ncbi:thioredoxin-like protein [Trichoderma novae-zelandiae]
MFRFHKTLDIITLFHKASSPASVRVANLLKQASVSAQTNDAQDAPARRDPFELNITEDPPTVDQVQTILEYVGQSGVSQVVKGARDDKDALKKFKENKENLLRPLTVDWSNGKAVAGDNESEILKLLNAQK